MRSSGRSGESPGAHFPPVHPLTDRLGLRSFVWESKGLTRMPSRAKAGSRHIFVCASGNPLPRWIEAFPALRCFKHGDRLTPPDPAGILWLRLGPGTAAAQVEAVLAAHPAAAVVVLADQPNDDDALALFSAGIRGYCNAHAHSAVLRQIAQAVAAGGLWIGPNLMKRLLVATGRALATVATPQTAVPDPRLASLTQRELEVARMIAAGASNKEVARGLGITERTVKAHAGSIFGKLGARDRLHLALIVNGRDRPAAPPPQAAALPAPAVRRRKG